MAESKHSSIMDTKPTENRLFWVDAARVFAIIAITLNHALNKTAGRTVIGDLIRDLFCPHMYNGRNTGVFTDQGGIHTLFSDLGNRIVRIKYLINSNNQKIKIFGKNTF